MANYTYRQKMKSMKSNFKPSKAKLPSLDKLAQREDTIKVTLLLNRSSIEYFKKAAQKREACYQAMIRNLVDEYVKQAISRNED
jgi:hypothetical protein